MYTVIDIFYPKQSYDLLFGYIYNAVNVLALMCSVLRKTLQYYISKINKRK